MGESRFVYVTYIRTTREKLWEALLRPEFTRKYWFEVVLESEWKKGSPWRMLSPKGKVADSGEVAEIDPPRKLVLTWRNEFIAEMKAEGYSRCTFELEPQGKSVKLTVVHEMEREGSKLIGSVGSGWPPILASLKSLLETGEALEETGKWPEGACE
jgi:uncharacterized protein YndB with AHSA1/START domain